MHSFSYSTLRSLHSFLYRSSASSDSSDQELEEALNKVLEREGVPDILVFGDTHKALVRRVQGFLFTNPGSATLPNYRLILGTVAILTISPGKAEADIIQL